MTETELEQTMAEQGYTKTEAMLHGTTLYAKSVAPPRPARRPPQFRRRFLGKGLFWRLLRRFICALAGHEDIWVTDRIVCCRYCGDTERFA